MQASFLKDIRGNNNHIDKEEFGMGKTAQDSFCIKAQESNRYLTGWFITALGGGLVNFSWSVSWLIFLESTPHLHHRQSGKSTGNDFIVWALVGLYMSCRKMATLQQQSHVHTWNGA